MRKFSLKRTIIKNLGIYYMLIACLFFAVTGAIAKFLSKDLPSIEVVFFRNIVGFTLIIYSLLTKPSKSNSKESKFWLLMMRGFIGTMGLFAFFYNIAHINLAAAFTFSKTSPIFTAILAFFCFKEKISKKAWLAICIGFLGIIFIVQPNLGIGKNDYLGIFSGLGAAIAYTSVKELKKIYDTRIIVLSFMAWGSFLPLICMYLASFINYPPLDFILSRYVSPNLNNIILILLMGIAGLAFQIYMTKSYAASKKMSSVAGVSYADVIFTLIIGYFMGDALPNLIAFIGIILIIFGGILIVKEKK